MSTILSPSAPSYPKGPGTGPTALPGEERMRAGLGRILYLVHSCLLLTPSPKHRFGPQSPGYWVADPGA